MYEAFNFAGKGILLPQIDHIKKKEEVKYGKNKSTPAK